MAEQILLQALNGLVVGSSLALVAAGLALLFGVLHIQYSWHGLAIVTVLGNQISWKVDITTAIDSVIAGHIHRGVADSAGGVVQSLAPTPTGIGFTGTVANGSALPPDSVLTLMRAGKAYVNIHTKAHTGGEIRGQLVKQ